MGPTSRFRPVPVAAFSARSVLVMSTLRRRHRCRPREVLSTPPGSVQEVRWKGGTPPGASPLTSALRTGAHAAACSLVRRRRTRPELRPGGRLRLRDEDRGEQLLRPLDEARVRQRLPVERGIGTVTAPSAVASTFEPGYIRCRRTWIESARFAGATRRFDAHRDDVAEPRLLARRGAAARHRDQVRAPASGGSP